MFQSIYQDLQSAKSQQKKKIAVLIDPDKVDEKALHNIVIQGATAQVDYFLVGGSLVNNNRSAEWIQWIKNNCPVPVIIFPGSTMQVNDQADAILFLSLISGRNPDLIIGRQVETAPILAKLDIEVISTGYMLIDGGKPTTVSYITNTHPIPKDKAQIAVSTALAGEMLGMKVMYLDSGSGAEYPVSAEMISAVSKSVEAPLVVGGGINTPEKAMAASRAGADLIVVGTAFEKDPQLVFEMSKAVHSLTQKVD